MKLDPEQLAHLARQMRRDILRMISSAGSGHPGGALGAAEIFAVLYGHEMRHAVGQTTDPDRDRFFLSNGHICAAWYSVLARVGYLEPSELGSMRKMGSRLQGHPSRAKWPEVVESSSGPLGQGLSVANGLALANRLSGSRGRVYCLVGDGELQEGIMWEAILSASHYGLADVTLIVSDNDLQIDGSVTSVKGIQPLGAKFDSFGWQAIEVDGHDTEALIRAFATARTEKSRPTAVIANTVMGRGVSFMENLARWHGACPSPGEVTTALEELGAAPGYTDYPPLTEVAR